MCIYICKCTDNNNISTSVSLALSLALSRSLSRSLSLSLLFVTCCAIICLGSLHSVCW